MSCAHHLAEHPNEFDVTLVEAADYCGGQAFSIPLDKKKTGASWMNQGVQGGSNIFHHTMNMFSRQGHHADPVKLQVSFGKDDTFWTNVYPTKLLEKHQKEIARFTTMLRIVGWFEVIFALIPIRLLMKLFGFSQMFVNTVALPMVALFLGTGNYTPEVPAIMLERLCTSPTYGMWYPPDKYSIASNLPPMVVFPNLSKFYDDWRKNLEKRGVQVRLNTEVTHVLRRDRKGVAVQMIERRKASNGQNLNRATASRSSNGTGTDVEPYQEEYEEIVLCVL
jgi:NAD(P)-binding Rossmann-like domain